ncbi:MAG: LCP family protein [Anaerolineae bacterium]
MRIEESYQGTHGRPLWLVLGSITALLAIALVIYTTYGVYTIVRTTVAEMTNLPSIEILKEQAGLSSFLPAPAPTQAAGGETAPIPQAGEGTPPPTAEPLLQKRINILLLGIDQRPGETGPFRTDSMIVVTIDPESGAVGMLSIPRDLWVPIPGYGENRINTAHFLGDLHKYPGGGPALAKKTVSYNFGFPVHYYVRVNFEGFRRLIDTIGGVDIDVPHEIRDDQYPDENYGYDPLYIPAGRIHMDGDLALKYARTRKADNDFERARRQQQIILAVRDKVLSLNLLPSLIPKIPELLRTLSDSIQTDIPVEELIMLARLARDLNTENIKTAVIDETMTVPQTTPTGAYVLLPIREKIRPVVDDLFLSPLPTVAPKR